MQRGTTQTLTFTLPEEIDIAELYITFNQNKGTVLEKSKSDASIDGKTIAVSLSQEDTLKFDDKAGLKIQQCA